MKKVKLGAILGLIAIAMCCKKETSPLAKETIQLYYRLALIKTNGDTTFSQIISTKGFLDEVPSTPNTGGNGGGGGQCNNPAGHNGCKCEEKSPDFCAKHPCHWKCRTLPIAEVDYFTLQNDNGIPTIHWSTNDETNVKTFALTRSTNSYDYKTIYSVKSNQKPSKYSYIDKK